MRHQNFEQSLHQLAQQDVKPKNLSIQREIDTSSSMNDPPMNYLASSIQSAVTAVLMHQQFNPSVDHQPSTIRSTPQNFTQRTPPINSSFPGPSVPTSAGGPTRTSFFDEQLRASLTNFNQQAVLSNNLQPPLMPPSLIQSPFNSKVTNEQQQQTNQRINYCTICNKELCNKYFMKTHMLKMHGINLETEQSGDNDSNQSGDDDSKEAGPSDSGPNEANSTESDGLSEVSKAKKNKNSSSSNTANKKQTSAIKQTTSVMNGFAGNSMGGVVCDICNKELCSKYFLKVHKQNTHGIMTDYQDAGQFVYPFANNPFNPLTAATSMGLGPAQNPYLLFGGGPAGLTGNTEDKKLQRGDNYSKATKKQRLAKMSDIGLNLENLTKDSPGSNSHLESSNQIDAFYRLMLAQQTQNPAGNNTILPPAGHPMPALAPLNSMAANPLSALMCFGGMTPFGMASMSPALVVDMILRNQHLFNRKNPTGSEESPTKGEQTTKNSSKDKNNNQGETDSKPKSGKSSKDNAANSSRYFSHYTEACPMCDRRFKSIKWLKTHMMNDHKQEIASYMQMMMQYAYMNKSQQHGPQICGSFGEPISQPDPSRVSLASNACQNLVNVGQHQFAPNSTHRGANFQTVNQSITSDGFAQDYLSHNQHTNRSRQLQTFSRSPSLSDGPSVHEDTKISRSEGCNATRNIAQNIDPPGNVDQREDHSKPGLASISLQQSIGCYSEENTELDLSLGTLARLSSSEISPRDEGASKTCYRERSDENDSVSEKFYSTDGLGNGPFTSSSRSLDGEDDSVVGAICDEELTLVEQR